MDVYLVRHAIADHRNPARWPGDARRPLTTKGAVRFRSAASGLHRLVAAVDVVLASP
jgi:phosphohistidine phosphatase SixA